VLLQIIANSYKQEHNLIGIRYKVSAFFVTAENDNSITQTAAPLLAVDVRCGAVRCDCSCPSTSIKHIGVM